MRVVIIGGSGHIGTYLVPRLVEAGHEVVNVSRGERSPYRPHAAWQKVRQVAADRSAEDAAGTFAGRIRALDPDVVIDLICFDPESARQLVEALRGRIQHFLHCGTIWTHGHSVVVPANEDDPRSPICDYGRKKLAIERLLLGEARRSGFPATVLHPGHIVGPGWRPINPAGHLTPGVFSDLAQGREVALPNLGMETLHHVHAADVAQAFWNAMRFRATAVGEAFHVVSPAAITLRGYAERMAAWFGREARLRFLPFDEWKKEVTEREAQLTQDHIVHSPNASIAKAVRLLDYRPRYSSLEAVEEAVEWLMARGEVEAQGRT